MVTDGALNPIAEPVESIAPAENFKAVADWVSAPEMVPVP